MIPSLCPVQRKLAAYVLESPERVLGSSIRDIQLGSGASAGSIVGFCQTLGTKGFPDFKIALARGMTQQEFSTDTSARNKPRPSILRKAFQVHTQSLEETLSLNSEKTLQETSLLIERARTLEFFSIGMSYLVAYSACYQLRMIGLIASALADCHLQWIAATRLRKGDIAFGISCSGNTEETIRCLQVARENRATTIALTNSATSRIASHSDLILYAVPCEVHYLQAPMASWVTQLALIDAVLAYTSHRRKQKAIDCLDKVDETLGRKRVGRQPVTQSVNQRNKIVIGAGW